MHIFFLQFSFSGITSHDYWKIDRDMVCMSRGKDSLAKQALRGPSGDPSSLSVKLIIIITSCVRGRGNKIGPVCLCMCVCLSVSTLTARNSTCRSAWNISRSSLMVIMWCHKMTSFVQKDWICLTREVCERSGVFIINGLDIRSAPPETLCNNTRTCVMLLRQGLVQY